MGSRFFLVRWSIERPKTVIALIGLLTVFLLLAALLPSVFPKTFPFLHGLRVDTDPENMLPEDEPVRVFHHRMKETLNLHDLIVVGVVNETHPDGVFNPDTLRNVYDLTNYALTLTWPDKKHPGKKAGVIGPDVIAPSTVDNIEPGGPGTVRFEWLMPKPPSTGEASIAIRTKSDRIPFLKGTLLSEDGKAVALYLPISSKDQSYKVYSRLLEKIATFKGTEKYHITGLPVAEDTFGVEMFRQMAISAPLAMVIIFLLMIYFFRSVPLVASPMIVAMISVIFTMGLLVAAGKTVHIMSSMIPIFIMPISVLDSIHLLSELFDRYPKVRDRKKVVEEVMDTLFTPMLYTSLTTIAGFASQATAPIPPVQVFGVFVAVGVAAAWVFTVTFIPAYFMLLPERFFEKFGASHPDSAEAKESVLNRLLRLLGMKSHEWAKAIAVGTVLVSIAAVVGMSRIQINDNPTKWFSGSHPIRVADRILNRHFGGTYMAFLALSPKETGDTAAFAVELIRLLTVREKEIESSHPYIRSAVEAVRKELERMDLSKTAKQDLLSGLLSFADKRLETASGDEIPAWEEIQSLLDEAVQRDQVFKRPEVLSYMESLQNFLLTTGVVGKSNSLTDIVKTVHRELFEGKEEAFRVPATPEAVAQCLITFQNSHRPQDLWHFVTPDFRTSSLWVQMKSGDNRDMSRVTRAVDGFFRDHPPPLDLDHKWFGLTYINVTWQEKMVTGMRNSFLESFVIVLAMMVVLLRSFLWGLISMIPLTVSIAFIYGIIGFIGKDYDMPVAVLSSLSLGLAVDYAIHFLVRTKALYPKTGRWKDTVVDMFGEPARAITKNAIVIGVGFFPLLVAPLVPYQTVGVFIAAILLTAGVVTLIILPAAIRLLEPWLFPNRATRKEGDES